MKIGQGNLISVVLSVRGFVAVILKQVAVS